MIGVRADQLPAIWADSVEVQLRFRGDKTWHKVTDVSETAEGIAVRFGDGTQDKTLAADEQVDVAATKDIGDAPGEGWAGG